MKILEEKTNTGKTRVCRAQKEDGTRVLVTIMNIARSSRSGIARFKQENEQIGALNIEGILKTEEIKEEQQEFVLVQEKFGDGDLKEYMGGNPLSIREFLDIGMEISRILGELHKNKIIHKDIRPRNILIDRQTGEIRLTGFGIGMELTHEWEDIYNETIIREILPYISPERTGRMNRAVDYRTDLYSLGIIFYEMLTGSVPFRSEDPLEVIHRHIAQRPDLISTKGSGVPEIISNIVMKLLSKTAEGRYQNGFGVLADLEQCRDRLRHNRPLEVFELGTRDISLSFILPQKLFGREEEVAELMTAFDRVRGLELMLVSGAPGIGKSVLIKEINKAIVVKRGYFISGKYEQYGREVPFNAIIQAFRGLVRNILTESKQKIETWQKKIGEALGALGKVVTEVIPEVELIIGKQPEVVELNPEESRNRFNLVFKNFIEVFAVTEHPLILFLDDLQWADRASLTFMRNMVSDPGIESMLLIGAYRNTEVSKTHLLTKMLDEIGQEQVLMHEIVLAPLSTKQVNDFVSEVLRCEKNRSYSLAELVQVKTGGNPFFIKQFMKTLYEKSLLEIDPEKGWYWDMERIKETNISMNVVELMVYKINELNDRGRDILKKAACIGDRFDLEMLAAITGKPISKALDELTESIEKGFIGISDDMYTFQHDRIREAAYSLIPEEIKKKLHLEIGRILLEKTPEDEWQEKIFYIVGQLNYGSDLLFAPEERCELARLNLEAGEKARQSTAFDSACRFFKCGIALLAPDAWEKHYDLTLALYTEGGEAAHLSGDHEYAEILFSTVLAGARTALDKARVYKIKINICTIWNRYSEALESGNEALELLGFSMPAKPGRLTIVKEMMKSKIYMKGRKIESLVELKDLTNPEKVAAARILMQYITTAYIGKPEYFPIAVLTFLNLSLRYGNSPESSFAYITYAIYLCGLTGRIEEGYRFGKLALNIVQKYDAVELTPKVNQVFGNLINHWKNHMREDFGYLMKAYINGPEAGDTTFGYYALINCVYRSILIGEPLGEAKKRYTVYHEEIKRYQLFDVLLYFECHFQLMLNLCEENGNRERIQGDIFDEDEILPYWIGVNNQNGAGSLLVMRMFLQCLYGVYEKVISTAMELKNSFGGIFSAPFVPLYSYYYSIALLACYSNCNKKEKKESLKQVRVHLKKLKKWAGHAPMNHLHRYYLVEAELARVRDNNSKAKELYNKAIQEAHNNEYLPDEVMAVERAAQFFRDCDDINAAKSYIARAWDCCTRWEAPGKLKHLEETYGNMIPKIF
ncbi:MAG: serine/threonine-protein kinase PknK [bacterium]|nr:serine/threonine-protein kinase PknK [bacterium]